MKKNIQEQSPCRVLMVFTILNRGGAETMVMNYYRHIDRSKVQFDFLVHREEEGVYEEEVRQMGGKIYRIPALSFSGITEYVSKVKEFFREHSEYEIVHGHCSENALWIYREARKNGVPCIIFHAHNSKSDKDWKTPFRWGMKHLSSRYANVKMACGKDAASWTFGKKLVPSVVILNNAIDASIYRYDKMRREKSRRENGWDGRFIIGNVARFSPQKNHMRLLRILKTILDIRSDALLVLVGEKNGLYEKVREEAHLLGIGDHIQFLGMRTDVSDLMMGMDVFCFPSHYEGLSLSMVEAQAAGLKVVASSSIDEEVNLIDGLVDFVSLSQPNEVWADLILAPYNREDTSKGIEKAGYDVSSNAHSLQEFYLKNITNQLSVIGLLP